LRATLKGDLLSQRFEWFVRTPGIQCPICQKAVREGSIHEVFLTRGSVQGLRFEDQMQIFIPQNTVILHEGECHLAAQHTDQGKLLCAKQIIHYESAHTVQLFLDYMGTLMTNQSEIQDARLLISEATKPK
jgi:hypothetical protein